VVPLPLLGLLGKQLLDLGRQGSPLGAGQMAAMQIRPQDKVQGRSGTRPRAEHGLDAQLAAGPVAVAAFENHALVQPDLGRNLALGNALFERLVVLSFQERKQVGQGVERPRGGRRYGPIRRG
jgi:hypothetical protein